MSEVWLQTPKQTRAPRRTDENPLLIPYRQVLGLSLLRRAAEAFDWQPQLHLGLTPPEPCERAESTLGPAIAKRNVGRTMCRRRSLWTVSAHETANGYSADPGSRGSTLPRSFLCGLSKTGAFRPLVFALVTSLSFLLNEIGISAERERVLCKIPEPLQAISKAFRP